MSATRTLERLVLTADLVAKTALHVGAAGSDGIAADLDIARDGAERPIIPGTSLAGCLRAASFACVKDDDQLQDAWRALFGTDARDPFGLRHGDDAAASRLRLDDIQGIARDLGGDLDDAAASRLRLDDAPLTTSGPERVERRDHVTIDRVTATAADRLKYDRVVVAPGSRFAARMTLERRATDPHGADVQMLFLLAELLEDGLALGGSSSRGLGRVRAEGLTVRRENLRDRDGALAALRARLVGRGLDGLEEVDRSNVKIPAGRPVTCTITIDWAPQRAMLIRDGAEGAVIDTLPLTTTVADGRVTLLLPGASIKGAMRSAAERIVRTATGTDAPDDDGTFTAAMKQLDVPVTRRLFGLPKGASANGARSALDIPDVHARHDAARSDWETALALQDPGVAHHALRSASDGELMAHASVMTHVALDRWTQGASDGRLFQVLEPTGVEWRPICLEIDVERLGSPEERLAAGVLLTLVLAELVAGDLPFGGMTTRGHGAIEVMDLGVEGGELLGIEMRDERVSLVDDEACRSAWQTAIGVTA